MKTEQKDLSAFLPRIEAAIRKATKGISTLSPEKVAAEFLDTVRIREQFSLLERYTGPVRGKRLLEVGSGYGLFVAVANKYFACQAQGVEPAEEIYSETYGIAREILEHWDLDPDLIRRGSGEEIPFPDNTFDVVYSSNVLEHVRDVKRVVVESIRVTKPGGTLQFVVPNYGSFWEGHYCIFWPPYLPPALAGAYVRLLGKDPRMLKELRFVNYFMLKNILRPFIREGRVRVLTWGEEIFTERMQKMNFSSWAGLATVRRWVEIAHKWGVAGFAARALVAAKACTPIVLTLRKEIAPKICKK